MYKGTGIQTWEIYVQTCPAIAKIPLFKSLQTYSLTFVHVAIIWEVLKIQYDFHNY